MAENLLAYIAREWGTMKVFKVWVDKCDLDEYDCCVVVAESAQAIRNKFKYQDRYWKTYELDIEGENLFFTSEQINSIDEIHIEEVDLTKESVVCASFNAG